MQQLEDAATTTQPAPFEQAPPLTDSPDANEHQQDQNHLTVISCDSKPSKYP